MRINKKPAIPGKTIVIVFLTLLIMKYSAAQDIAANDFRKAGIDSAVGVYNRFINKQSRLNNGKEFRGYSTKLQGNPFYLADSLQTGNILYDGIFFDNIPILYDIVKDEVITTYSEGYLQMCLISEKLKQFSFLGHSFIRLESDSASASPIVTGFYEKLYEHRTALFAKRIKTIEEKIDDGEIVYRIAEKNHYYILKNGIYHPVNTYDTMLEAFNDAVKDIRQYIKKNKLRYRKAPENTLLQVVTFYDSLKK